MRLAAYVEGRDALTGAIGGAIDFVLGSSESEEEAADAIGKVRSAIHEAGGELGDLAAECGIYQAAPVDLSARELPQALAGFLQDDPPPQRGNQTSQCHQGGANRPFSLSGGD